MSRHWTKSIMTALLSLIALAALSIGALLPIALLGAFAGHDARWIVLILLVSVVGVYSLSRYGRSFFQRAGIAFDPKQLRPATSTERQTYWNEPVALSYFMVPPFGLVLSAILWRWTVTHTGEWAGSLTLVLAAGALGLLAHETARLLAGLPSIGSDSVGYIDLSKRVRRSSPATVVNEWIAVILTVLLGWGLILFLSQYVQGTFDAGVFWRT